MRIAPLLLATLIGLTGCGSQRPAAQGEHHYQLTGKVVALNAKNDTATIDAAAIPNFMEAMTMEYPIKSKADFSALHVGDEIKATVNVRDDGGYNLSDIQKQTP